MTPPSDATLTAALCLSGGNALGAWQAGVLTALLQAGSRFPVIAGTSIGAVAGALVAGNEAAAAPAAITAFWQAARLERPVWPFMSARQTNLTRALVGGHPRLFRPRVPGLLSALAGVTVGPALYDRSAMRDLLVGLIDFDRLNGGETQLLVTAMDAETGTVLTFDNRAERIGPDHLMAATAFPVLFEPCQIGGRKVCDAGPRRNLPLDSLAGRTEGLPVLALDLFPLAGSLPADLGGVAARAQDLVMAGQSADAIARFRAVDPDTVIVHACYTDVQDRTAGKTLDYDAAVLDRRHQCGVTDAAALLDQWVRIADEGGTTVGLEGGKIALRPAEPDAHRPDAHGAAPARRGRKAGARR